MAAASVAATVRNRSASCVAARSAWIAVVLRAAAVYGRLGLGIFSRLHRRGGSRNGFLPRRLGRLCSLSQDRGLFGASHFDCSGGRIVRSRHCAHG